jgi:hypothetical protein
MAGMSDADSTVSLSCSGAGTGCACTDCEAMRAAAAAGARPSGVPIRIYGAYLEARAALRTDASSLAIQTLEWLLHHLAESRGARAELGLAAKVEWLRRQGVLLPRLPQSLFDQALSTDPTRERAWALLSLAEHAFHRLYLSGRSGQ